MNASMGLLLLLSISFLVHVVLAKELSKLLEKQMDKSAELYSAFIQDIYKETHFEGLTILRNHAEDCLENDASLLGAYTKLLLNASNTFRFVHFYNRKMLLVVCLKAQELEISLLQTMIENLDDMRATRTLFMLKTNHIISTKAKVKQLFQYCRENQMLNVLAIDEQFARNRFIYSYAAFPTFVVKQRYYPTANYYPNRLSNMQLQPFITLSTQMEPDSLMYLNRKGMQSHGGYVHHLIALFVHKLNATLTYKYPTNNGQTYKIALLVNLTNHNELDIPICLATPYARTNMLAYSNIVTITSWMPMLPIATYLKTYEFFVSVLSDFPLAIYLMIMLIYNMLHCTLTYELLNPKKPLKQHFNYMDVLLNDKIFRGFLGLSFQTIHRINLKFFFIYFALFVQGLLQSTSYSAKLSSMFNEPPRHQQIDSFAQLRQSNIKILIPAVDTKLLSTIAYGNPLQKYADIFLIIPDMREYNTLLNSLDPAFAYSVKSHNWALVNKQQKYFAKRLFRISKHMYFTHFLFMTFPLPKNSIYRDAFNTFLSNVQAYGFWHYWTSMNFYEMIVAGKMKSLDLTKRRSYEPLCVKDYYYIWLMFVVALCIALLSFIGELSWKHHRELKRVLLKDFRINSNFKST